MTCLYNLNHPSPTLTKILFITLFGFILQVTAKQATITGFTPIYPTYRGGRGGQGAFRGRGGRGRGGRGGALTIESPPAGNQDPHTPDISSSTSTQQQARDILNKNSATATASAAGVTVQLRASTQPKRNLPNDLSKNPPKKQKSLSSNIEEVQVLSFAEIIKRKRETEQALKEAQEGAIPPETNGDAESMSNEPTPKVMEDSESVRFEVNARILGTWEGSDDWYTGVITACHDDGTYDVLYDDGDVEQHKDPSGLQVAPDDEVEES